MVDVKSKPHYWIYEKGKDVWNTWTESSTNLSDLNSREAGGLDIKIKKQILEDIKLNCPPETVPPETTDEIDFKETNWNEVANFEGFLFKPQVNFEDAVFEESCIFMGADFQHRALFAKAIFHKKASFVNSKVNMLISFYQCKFKLEAPFINGIETKGIISFDGCKWPILPDEPKYKEGMNDEQRKEVDELREIYFKKISNYKNAYCYLKSSMNDRDIHDMEIMFFRLELEAKSRLQTTTYATKLLIWLYRITSNYGDGALKPFLCLLGTSAIFVLIYISFSSIDSWMMAFQISLANSIPFVTPNKMLSTEIIDLTCLSDMEALFFNLARGAHITFSIIFIFLMGLGFRNRLRLK